MLADLRDVITVLFKSLGAPGLIAFRRVRAQSRHNDGAAFDFDRERRANRHARKTLPAVILNILRLRARMVVAAQRTGIVDFAIGFVERGGRCLQPVGAY